MSRLADALAHAHREKKRLDLFGADFVEHALRAMKANEDSYYLTLDAMARIVLGVLGKPVDSKEAQNVLRMVRGRLWFATVSGADTSVEGLKLLEQAIEAEGSCGPDGWWDYLYIKGQPAYILTGAGSRHCLDAGDFDKSIYDIFLWLPEKDVGLYSADPQVREKTRRERRLPKTVDAWRKRLEGYKRFKDKGGRNSK